MADSAVQHHFKKACDFYKQYNLWPRASQGIIVTTGMYTFTTNIPFKILGIYDLNIGSKVGNWSYTNPILMIPNGNYSIQYEMAADPASISELPPKLQELYVNYVKRQIGQKLKFSSFAEKPFDIDGEGWYNEGNDRAKETEEFIMINRDEDPNNISDLSGNTYSSFYSNFG